MPARPGSATFAGKGQLNVGSTPFTDNIFLVGFTTNSVGWQGFNLRVAIGPSALSAVVDNGQVVGTRIQVTTGTGNSSANLDSCYIGFQADSGNLYDFGHDPVQVTFDGGAAGITGFQNLHIYTSDFVPFIPDFIKGVLVSFYFSGTQVNIRNVSSVAFDAASFFLLGSNESSQTI